MRFLIFFFVLFYIPAISSSQTQTAKTSMNNIDSIAQEINRINFASSTEAHRLLNNLYQIAGKSPDSLQLYAKCLCIEAELWQSQGIYDSTLIYRIQKELQRTDPSPEIYSRNTLNYALALTLLIKGDPSGSFTTALKVVEQFKEMKDSLFIAKSLHILGRVSYYIESFQLAEDYFKQARKYTNPTQKEYYQINSNIYIAGTSLYGPEKYIDSLLYITSTIDDYKYPGMRALNYLNIGVIYSILRNYDKAYQYYMDAQNNCPDIDNKAYSFSFYHNLGRYYVNKFELQKAYRCFLKTKNLARQSGNPNFISTNLFSLSDIHEQLNHTDSAYYYLKEYNIVKNKTVNTADLIGAYKAYISVFLETSQKELIIKEQEILLTKRRQLVTVISALLIILSVVSLLIMLQLQKRNIKQQAHLKEIKNRELEKTLKIKQQIEQLQEDKIAVQDRELTSYSLALATKNNILQQIAEITEHLPEDKTAINEIRKVVKSNLDIDKTWKNFVIHFNNVHPDFFSRIKSFSNDLSENDLRLCAYLRISMTTKQIAQMLNISPESIRMHKYRVKKKLGFPEDKNLDDFIREI